MTLRCRAAALSDRGRLRQKDEDAFLLDEEAGIFAVADGVGGHSAGEVASRVAVEEAAARLRSILRETQEIVPEYLVRSFRQAGERIRRESEANASYGGMASTLVLALVRPPAAWIAHVGDSRAYLWRQGRLSRLTRDHSAFEQFSSDNPGLDRGWFEQSPLAHVLTRCLGGDRDASPEVRTLPVEPGDRLLLCCDGLTDMVSDLEIARVLADRYGPPQCCQRLVESANAAGGKDNITVVVVDVQPHESRD